MDNSGIEIGVGLSDVQIVHTPDPNGPYERSHPGDIAVLDAQTIVLAWRETIRERTDMGAILISRSTNGGQSWTPAREILSGRDEIDGEVFSYGNVILHAENGVVTAIVGRSPLSHSDSEEQRLFALQSRDAGQNWAPIPMNFPDSSFITGGKILQHQGRYLLPFHRNETRHDLPAPRFRPRSKDEKRDHGVLISDDFQTWKVSEIIPQNSADDAFLQEGYLVPAQDDSGDVLCFMRSSKGDNLLVEHDPPRAFSSRSRDGGRSWETAQIEPELFNSNAKAIVARDSNGNYVCVYNVGPIWKRQVLKYKTKWPNQPWSEEKHFFSGGNYNAYVSLEEFAPGRFYAMWWASPSEPGPDTRAVRFGIFEPVFD